MNKVGERLAHFLVPYLPIMGVFTPCPAFFHALTCGGTLAVALSTLPRHPSPETDDGQCFRRLREPGVPFGDWTCSVGCQPVCGREGFLIVAAEGS